MSRFNRASSVVQQEKEKIILISGNGGGNSTSLFRTRMGLVKFDNQMNYDPSFQTMDPITKVAFTPGSGGINDIAIDSSLNIYVGGSFSSYRGSVNNRIMKLLPTGDKDTSFDNTTGFNSSVMRILLDNNNKLYCFGYFTTYKGVTANRIIRLNSDGSKDVSFDNTTGFNATVEDVAFDSLGRMYCTGTFTSYKGNTCNRIVRINTDGSYDNTFAIGVGFNNPAYSIFIDSSDKIFVGGTFSTYSGISANGIVKLNSDGSIDTSFDYGTGFLPLTNVNKIECDEIGNIYVSISSDTSVYKNNSTSYGLVKIDSSGNFVSNLNLPANSYGTIPLRVIDSENIIYTKDTSLCVLNSSGVVKKTLSTSANSLINYAKLDLSGNTYLYGGIDNSGIFNKSFGLGLPLGEDGLIKPEKFNQNYGITRPVGATTFNIENLTKNNELIYIPCSTYNGVQKKDILKLTLNGSIVNEFDTGTGFQYINSCAVDTDTLGNIYIITNSPSYKNEIFTSNSAGVLIKIKRNGDRDTSFNPVVFSTNISNGVDMKVQSDNKVIVIYNQGNQFNLSGQTYNGVIRFNTNGSIDNTFSGGTWSSPFGSTPGISKSYLHTDDKLYLRVSNFPVLTYNGVSVGEFVKLNSDGSLDNTFNTNTTDGGGVEGLFVDNYDKVWVWGSFTSYSGVTNNRVLRLNNDGTIDYTFDNSIGFNSAVYKIEYDSDTDKVYCVGPFTTYKNLSYRYLISLNYNGTINTFFSVSAKNVFGSNQSIAIINL